MQDNTPHPGEWRTYSLVKTLNEGFLIHSVFSREGYLDVPTLPTLKHWVDELVTQRHACNTQWYHNGWLIISQTLSEYKTVRQRSAVKYVTVTWEPPPTAAIAHSINAAVVDQPTAASVVSTEMRWV